MKRFLRAARRARRAARRRPRRRLLGIWPPDDRADRLCQRHAADARPRSAALLAPAGAARHARTARRGRSRTPASGRIASRRSRTPTASAVRLRLYLALSRTSTSAQPFDLTPACKDGNCVSAQIERDVEAAAATARPPPKRPRPGARLPDPLRRRPAPAAPCRRPRRQGRQRRQGRLRHLRADAAQPAFDLGRLARRARDLDARRRWCGAIPPPSARGSRRAPSPTGAAKAGRSRTTRLCGSARRRSLRRRSRRA